ncbi:MAG: hypothetical protein ACUVSQ_07310 [Pseudanabaenaceae cyanobacterium]
MSLFRSRLFRWLAQSWPVQWGRQTRQRLQRPIRQIETWIAQAIEHLQPTIAPVWEATRQRLLPTGAEPPPPLLWLEGVPTGVESPPPPLWLEEVPAGVELPPPPPRRLAAVRVRLVRIGRASWQRLRGGALAPPIVTLDRRIPRKSFAEILAEAIAYYFGRRKPSLSPTLGLTVADGVEPPATVSAHDSGQEPVAVPIPPLRAIEAPAAVPTLETRAVFLGYAYGPLVEFLLWLDRWVERIENFCLRIWRWLRQWGQA